MNRRIFYPCGIPSLRVLALLVLIVMSANVVYCRNFSASTPVSDTFTAQTKLLDVVNWSLPSVDRWPKEKQLRAATAFRNWRLADEKFCLTASDVQDDRDSGTFSALRYTQFIMSRRSVNNYAEEIEAMRSAYPAPPNAFLAER